MDGLKQKHVAAAGVVSALLLLLAFAATGFGQTLLLNGSTAGTGFVGDPIHIRYEFSPGQHVAWAEVWFDLNGDGAISSDDYLMYSMRHADEFIFDGEGDDADSTVNGIFESTIDEFMSIAPITYIFAVYDSGGSATATLSLEYPPFAKVIHGRVGNPPEQANLFVFAAPIFDEGPPPPEDSTKIGKLGPAASGRDVLLSKIMQSQFQLQMSHEDFRPCFDDSSYGPPPPPPEEEKFGFMGTLTDSAGSFSLPIPDFVSDRWIVGVTDRFELLDGLFPPPPMMFSIHDSIPDMEFFFMEANAVIRGMVLDVDGNPLINSSGAPMELEINVGNARMHTWVTTRTVNGEFSVDVVGGPDGDYEISVADVPDGYMHGMGENVHVEPGDTADVNFRLIPIDAEIIGRVTIADSIPVPCVRVMTWNEAGGGMDAFTDENGEYVLHVSSFLNPWKVELDTRTIPHGYRIEGDWGKEVVAPADHVDFILVEDDSPPPPPPGDGAPKIAKIHDIPADQGLQVRVIWFASPMDFRPENNNQTDQNSMQWGPNITHYNLWRRGPAFRPDVPHDSSGVADGTGKRAAQPGVRVVKSMQEMMRLAKDASPGQKFQIANEWHVWDFIATVPAMHFPVYAYVAPTLHDSTRFGTAWSHFLVSAHTYEPLEYWLSEPDSGYSVDNLAPRLENVTARAGAEGVVLTWQTPNSPDIVGARIYRSESSTDGIASSNLVGVTTENIFRDREGRLGQYYRVVVEDDAGNIAQSQEIIAGVTGVELRQKAGVPDRFVLEQNYPNPFNPSTQLSFGLPVKSDVTLDIFDMMGRHVIRLVQGVYAAGTYTALWNGRDKHGRLVSSGVYLYKLRAGENIMQKRMIFTK